MNRSRNIQWDMTLPLGSKNENAWTQADRRERVRTVLMVLAAILIVGSGVALLAYGLFAH